MSTGATPIDDPNVKLPGAIKAIAAQADELHRAAYPKDPPAADPPPKDPPADPPVTTTGNEPPKDEPPKDGFEHAYKSMKGRYESAKETIRALNERIAAIELEVRSRPATQPAATAPESLVTEQEVADYGKEFLDVVGKKAREATSQELLALRQQVADLTNALQGVGKNAAQGARERMKTELMSQVPNWEEINNAPEFLDWLTLSDPFSGAIRHDLLKQAWGRNETARVLAFFKGFLAQEAAVAPAAVGPDTQATGKIPLETFAAPGRAKSAAEPASPAEKPIIKASEIASFYTDVAAGRWRGREKEKDAFEQRMMSAQREGRIDQRR